MPVFYKILSAFCAADLFLWWCSARAMGRTAQRGLRLAVHGFFAAQITLLAVMFWSAHHRSYGQVIPPEVLSLTLIWYLLVAPLALLASLLGLAGKAASRVLRFFRPPPPAPSNGDTQGMSRREFLGTLAVLTPPVLTFSLGALAAGQAEAFRIRRLTLRLPTLPPVLEGMTIAHLADLHVGQLTKGHVLQKVVEATNQLKADLVLFSGDLINGDTEFLPRALEVLRALRPLPVLCEGNHDVSEGSHGFETRIKAAGLCLLADETVTVPVRNHPVQLLGMRWGGPGNWQDRHNEHNIAASMASLLSQRNPAAFQILLAHHPHAWDYCGDIPLTLSGHTHGGQLMLDEQHGFGPLMFRYWSGAYYRPAPPARATQALIVNNGIGNWFPLRVAAPAEIVHLTLRRG